MLKMMTRLLAAASEAFSISLVPINLYRKLCLSIILYPIKQGRQLIFYVQVHFINLLVYHKGMSIETLINKLTNHEAIISLVMFLNLL